MKKAILPLCACACVLLLSGCRTHYLVVLDNGAQITTRGKPKLRNGYYRFKDISGQQRAIPAGRVREYEPASRAKDTMFNQ